jgi:hypothetical protein
MMVCGVLGPRSNAHGPNEFLHALRQAAHRCGGAGHSCHALETSVGETVGVLLTKNAPALATGPAISRWLTKRGPASF